MNFAGSFEDGAVSLAKALENSVKKSLGGQGKVAVAFSGGLDSSILATCAKRNAEVVACCGAALGSIDDRKAVRAANLIGVQLLVSRLTLELVFREVEALKLPFPASPMDESLWCLYSVVSRRAADAGARVILLGQMADELFGGYSKYETALEREGAEAAQMLMERDVQEYPTRGRVRDVGACSAWLSPKLPFEDEDVKAFGESFPLSFKIRDGVRKAVLRRAAVLLGVPEELTLASKKAAQYSSGIQRLLD